MSESLKDTRGGVFHVFDGKRVHETDLTTQQRQVLGLDAPTIPAEQETPTDTVTTDE